MIKRMISQEKCRNQKNESIYLKYYLTEMKAGGKTVYGVLIEKYMVVNRREELESYDYVEDLSYNKGDVLGLIKKLAKGLVTPYGLVDVLDDCM